MKETRKSQISHHKISLAHKSYRVKYIIALRFISSLFTCALLSTMGSATDVVTRSLV